MNLQISPVEPPLRLLVVNPLLAGSKLAISEIMAGSVFGYNRYIDLILLVYCNEISLAEQFKMELRGCAFANCNNIVVSSDLPSLSDADVFMFISNFKNPNRIDYTNLHDERHFDTMYLILKVATNLTASLADNEIKEEEKTKRKKNIPEKKKEKPVIVADGLITLYILREVCKDLPSDILFCPTPVPVVVRSVLADYLKTELTKFNHVHAWAADDEIFHFEIEKPLIKSDTLEESRACGKEVMGNETLELYGFDYLQLCDNWLKTELREKVVSRLGKNPYGSIFRASEIVRILQYIWKPRITNGLQLYINLGVISDGSLGSLKGLPCVLPLIIEGENWNVNKYFDRDSYMRTEMKRINIRVKHILEKFTPYCRKFMEDNVVQKNFVPAEEDMMTMSDTTTRTTEV
ncbi:uncharacterized protein LOC128672619 [Plodia interpunctella]|uniref:uncharacterized protein LOC128672619 n=1 Tax=Plodia interpunctella TaxID=58824 RepID=UPI002368C30D|nr:uncharacterized protein LOC128672619 [Plodia interpunctella]